jgi:hypothetical protein
MKYILFIYLFIYLLSHYNTGSAAPADTRFFAARNPFHLTKGTTNLLCILEFTYFLILPPQLLVVLCGALTYT